MRIFSVDVGMVFGQDKCVVVVLKRRKMVGTVGIELPHGKCMIEVSLERYKYLEVLQLDSIMNREMEKNEYIRRVKKLLKSQFHGGNVIARTNAWAVDIIRYGSLHLKENVGRLYHLKIRRRKTTYELRRTCECESAKLRQVS